MGAYSQMLRSRGEHDTAYVIEILEERCAYYVEDLEIAAEHLLTIRDWLGEGKLEAIDNLAGDVASKIATRLKDIAAHGADEITRLAGDSDTESKDGK